MRGLSFGVMGDDSLNWVGYNLVGFGGQLPDQYGDFIPKLGRNKLVSVPRQGLRRVVAFGGGCCLMVGNTTGAWRVYWVRGRVGCSFIFFES